MEHSCRTPKANRERPGLRHLLYQFGQKASYVLLSPREKRNTAVIFVHGFRGNAIATWSQFQIYVDYPDPVDLCEWWSTADLYFYGYNSLKGSISDQALSFLDFLDSVFPRPSADLLVAAPELLESLREKMGPLIASTAEPPSLPIQYERLVLTGHSLGAVIIRQAVLERAAAYELELEHAPAQSSVNAHPILRAELRLFAPAIFGFNPSRLMGLMYNLPLGHSTLRKWLAPVIQSRAVTRDLEGGSTKLLNVRHETERLALKTGMPALKAHILFGQEDDVVDHDHYIYDVAAAPLEGHGHISICKPDFYFRRPLEFVAYGARLSATA